MINIQDTKVAFMLATLIMYDINWIDMANQLWKKGFIKTEKNKQNFDNSTYSFSLFPVELFV